MKKTCSRYTPEDISRFVDRELSRERYQKLAQHLPYCSDCEDLVEKYKTITDTFNDHARSRNLEIDPHKLKQKIVHTRQDSRKNSLKNMFGVFNKNIYLKLASITAILIISLLAFQGRQGQPAGPSAIVTSVNTDFSSIMIIETQHQKHTIIWFSET